MSGTRPPVWLASKDGIAHARYDHLPRVVCGAVAVDPRLAWPEVTRCRDCVRLVVAEMDR